MSCVWGISHERALVLARVCVGVGVPYSPSLALIFVVVQDPVLIVCIYDALTLYVGVGCCWFRVVALGSFEGGVEYDGSN